MKFGQYYEMLAHHYINRKKVDTPRDLSDGKGILIMATGKSANDYWNDQAVQGRYRDYDMLVMNRSIYKMEKEIMEKRPRYFAACDPIYWGSGSGLQTDQQMLDETAPRTKAVLEKVDWDCYLITSIHEEFQIDNPHVHILRMNATLNDADSDTAYWLYAGNYCSPKLGNIGQVAIYFAITFGYKDIRVIGMDYDFFKNLYCDENCNVGIYAEHQYDGKDSKVVKGTFDKKAKGMRNGSFLAKYLADVSNTFASYGKLQLYAERQGAKIYNCSLHSMIDCYEKKAL